VECVVVTSRWQQVIIKYIEQIPGPSYPKTWNGQNVRSWAAFEAQGQLIMTYG